MIGNLLRVPAVELEQFKSDSSKLADLVYKEETYSEPWFLELDKTWEALHFVLSGKSFAESAMEEDGVGVLETAVLGAQIIDPTQDLGYGPATYSEPQRVKEILTALQQLDLAALEQSFEGVALNEAGIYPEIWDEPDAKTYLFDNLKALLDLYQQAADQDQAVIGFVN